MKKFWEKPRYKVRRGDLFSVCEEVGFGDFALALLDFEFVQADDIFECWKDENGRYHVEHVKRLGWGHGVSPSLPLCPAQGPDPQEPCCSENCWEAGECRRHGVRLDNTLHK